MLNRSGRIALVGLGVVAVSLWTYVAWPSYLNVCRVEAGAAWSIPYGQVALGWDVIRDQTEPGCTVAYANTFQIYPLYGFDLTRRLVYVPTRPGLERLDQLPRMRAVIGEDVPGEVSRVMMEGADRGDVAGESQAQRCEIFDRGEAGSGGSEAVGTAAGVGFCFGGRV